MKVCVPLHCDACPNHQASAAVMVNFSDNGGQIMGPWFSPYETAVDFLNHENPPTWAGVESTTLGAEGQRQSNHATQPAHE
ncbi:hypothetical protein TNCV_4205991 [Trichonephila clavipes]|nr:hypothetical protein TNCV_4205991 [Trichonephila clavipes]